MSNNQNYSIFRVRNVSPRKKVQIVEITENVTNHDPSPPKRVRFNSRSNSLINKYDLDEFFENEQDETKLLAAINNEFSDLNMDIGSDRWQTLQRIVAARQNYSSLILKKRKQLDNTTKNYPFWFERKNQKLRTMMTTGARRHIELTRMKVNAIARNSSVGPDPGPDDDKKNDVILPNPRYQDDKKNSLTTIITKYKDRFSDKSYKKIQDNLKTQELINSNLSKLMTSVNKTKQMQEIIKHEQKVMRTLFREEQKRSPYEDMFDTQPYDRLLKETPKQRDLSKSMQQSGHGQLAATAPSFMSRPKKSQSSKVNSGMVQNSARRNTTVFIGDQTKDNSDIYSYHSFTYTASTAMQNKIMGSTSVTSNDAQSSKFSNQQQLFTMTQPQKFVKQVTREQFMVRRKRNNYTTQLGTTNASINDKTVMSNLISRQDEVAVLPSLKKKIKDLETPQFSCNTIGTVAAIQDSIVKKVKRHSSCKKSSMGRNTSKTMQMLLADLYNVEPEKLALLNHRRNRRKKKSLEGRKYQTELNFNGEQKSNCASNVLMCNSLDAEQFIVDDKSQSQ